MQGFLSSCTSCSMILGNKLNPCLYYCSIDVLRVIHTHLHVDTHIDVEEHNLCMREIMVTYEKNIRFEN